MWPRKLPEEVLRNELRSAERKVFTRMAAELDDSWVVFYSRPWLGLKPDGEEIDGECDFLVARADSGILAIEVKGGGISYEPQEDQWTSQDRYGFRHRIKNPVAQAKSSKYQILSRLKDRPALKHRRLRAAHAVILPDAESVRSDLGPDMPPWLFCCRPDFERGLANWLTERLGTIDPASREEPLGRDGLSALETLLAKPFQIRMTAGHVARGDDAELATLTPQQFRILSLLDEVPRAAVVGAAGTGKTVLAIEKARRCAEAGLRTLITCFNRPLAEYLSTVLQGVPRLDVMTFQACCRRKAELAGLDVPAGALTAETLANTFPELLVDAMGRRPDLAYDAVIVDEGQDFQAHWWVAVDSLLDPGGKGILYIFHDANQRVYPYAAQLPREVKGIPFPLSENLRNTQRIHDVVRPHYTGPRVVPVGPMGQPVRWAPARNGDTARALDAAVSRCVGEDGVRPEDLAVLVSSETRLRELCPTGRLGGHPTAPWAPKRGGVVTLETVRRFKGMESPAAILVMDGDVARDRELLYVALSRARTFLVVVGSQADLDAVALGSSGDDDTPPTGTD
jgi:hypothetical protein